MIIEILITVPLIISYSRIFDPSGISIPFQDFVHWSGWMALLSMVISSTYLIAERIFPRTTRKMIKIHCLMGLLPLPFLLYHIYGGSKGLGYIPWTSNFILLMVIILQLTGAILKYSPISGKIRYYCSTLHPPLALGIYLYLIFHVLNKL